MLYISIMKLNWRKWHHWISIFIAVPFLVTLITGLLLASRGFNSWVQPSYPPVKKELKISFDQILNAAKQVPEAQITNWADVAQIDVRPATGNIRLRSKTTLWEIQIDGETGQVLGKGVRRASLLMALHEGAYFGPFVRYGVFFVSAWGVLFLTISGLVLFFQSYRRKRK